MNSSPAVAPALPDTIASTASTWLLYSKGADGTTSTMPVADDPRPKENGRRQKQSTAKSIRGPVDSMKASKGSVKRRSPRLKISTLCDTAEEMTANINHNSNQAFKAKEASPAFLRHIHPSRVRKPDRKRPIGPSTPHSKRGNNTPSGRKTMQQSACMSLRRSTRISKQPANFGPGFA